LVAQYDDDDIVEDYEEVSSGQNQARRVESAQGGPVQRPGDRPVRPSDKVRPGTSSMPALGDKGGQSSDPNQGYDDGQNPMAKGKVSAKQAKLIWIICIAICILGPAAVAVHYFFIRKAPEVPQNTGTARANTTPKPKELSPRQILEQRYVLACVEKRKEIQLSRAYDLLLVAWRDARNARKAAMDTSEDKALWMKAYEMHFRAATMEKLLEHTFKPDTSRLTLGTNELGTPSEMEWYKDEDLTDPAQILAQAYQLAVSNIAKQINENKVMIQSKAIAGAMWNDETYGPQLKKWQADMIEAGEKGIFSQEDLDYVNRPPRGPDEPAPYLD
jgi:hypothetical protein